MGKDQGLSLTPRRLAGACGKLKCCLAYEADTYREYLEEMALKVGHRVVTVKGDGKIIDMDVLNRKVRVALIEGGGGAETFSADHVARIKGGVRPELPEAVREAQAAEVARSRSPMGSVLGTELNLDDTDTNRRRRRQGNRSGGHGGEGEKRKGKRATSKKESSDGDRQASQSRRRRRRRQRGGGSSKPKGDETS